jgi:hypothetical protein
VTIDTEGGERRKAMSLPFNAGQPSQRRMKLRRASIRFFGTFTHRRNTMIDASQIREHLEVVGSDGGHVGRVDHVVGGEIELAKLDLGGGLKHHMIPITWVDHVDDDAVHLTLSKDDAKAGWREKH